MRGDAVVAAGIWTGVRVLDTVVAGFTVVDDAVSAEVWLTIGSACARFGVRVVVAIVAGFTVVEHVVAAICFEARHAARVGAHI